MQTNHALPNGQQPVARPLGNTSRVTIPILVAVLMLGLGINTNAQTATVNFATINQTITGLGGGITNYGGWVFPNFTSTVADTLFCNGTNQLGLSLLRLSIDPGGENPVDSMKANPDNDGWGWAGQIDSAATAQSEAAGCGGQVFVFATPWAALCDPSPGTCYSSNGTLFGGSVPTADYVDFGDWLASYVNYATTNGVSLTAVSLANEPGASPGNFGYNNWKGTTNGTLFDAWFAGSGDASPIINAGSRIMFPETSAFDPSWADTTLQDPAAKGYVGILAGHCYGNLPANMDTYATALGIPQWMTECYQGEWTNFTQQWIDAIEMAQKIALWMNGGYQAYGEWLIEDAGPETNSYFVFDNGFYDYVHSQIEGKGYAMGQYSKFVRPGYRNVSATYQPTTDVNVTAYEGDGNFVIVAINDSGSSVNQAFDIEGATVASVTPYVSSSPDGAGDDDQPSCTTCLAPQSAVSVSSGSFSYNLPAWSIVTFVGGGTTTAWNMVANPRFSTGDLAGWGLYGSGSASAVTVQKDTSFSGYFYSLQETGTGFSGWAKQTVINQPAGYNFTVKAWAKTNNANGYIEVTEPGGTGYLCETLIGNNVGVWTQYSCTGTVPSSGSGAGQMLIRLATNSLSSGNYVYWEDPTISVTP